MRIQEYMSLQFVESQNLCPVCGAKIALAEVTPHPKRRELEIQGFVCKTCGPVKSMVVRSRLKNERLC